MIYRLALLFCTQLLFVGCLSGESLAEVVAPPEKKGGAQYRSYVTVPCAKVVAGILDNNQRGSYLLVIRGFMTGTNYLKGRTANFEESVMLARVEGYCRQNPGHFLNNALAALDLAADRAGTPEGLPLASAAKPPAAGKMVAAAQTVAPPPGAGQPQSVQGAPPSNSSAAAVPGPQAPISQPVVAAESSRYMVLVISTKSKDEADRVAGKLKRDKFPASAEPFRGGDKGDWYRVVVGPYADRQGAKDMHEQLVKANYKSAIVISR